jgi:predicted Rossmann fold flavoprotein
VTARDFWGGSSPVVRRILGAFSSADAIAFFETIGLPLREEEDGKLFPVSGRARDVLNALLAAVQSSGARLLTGHRVTAVDRIDNLFHVTTPHRVITSPRLVFATGGQSLPKTGSDGVGFDFARRLGHTIVPTTPALVPLVLDQSDPRSIHQTLSGVSHDVELTLHVEGRALSRFRGSLLWTHFGISGPVVLNVSRHWLRAQLEGRRVVLTMSACPGESFAQLDARWTTRMRDHPRTSLLTALADDLPASMAASYLDRLEIDRSLPLAHLPREVRRRLLHAILEWPLAVTACRGYNYAEATAGGVTLTEIDPATMGSRVCRGLYLVGEILDVDGRIGGFNFQWAWSTGYVAGRALR